MYVLEEFDKNLELVLNDGYDIIDRTGIGCRFLPGIKTTIDISDRVPVPTRRKTSWKSMLNEYLWFLTGSDNIKDLQKMGSRVWDSWDNEQWCQDNGFFNGSIGYGYGPNLIRYGADINDKWDFGFNQIDYVINELKNKPNSRRILFSFWRPDKVGESNVRLEPCHLIYQFIVNKDKLTCVVYQRSSDMFVGNLSTNLQGATFYTYMIAQQVGLIPDKLIHISGHAHIYHNHFDSVKEYLSREKPNSPILLLNKKSSIYDYTSDDFTLFDYSPLKSIKVDVAV